MDLPVIEKGIPITRSLTFYMDELKPIIDQMEVGDSILIPSNKRDHIFKRTAKLWPDWKFKSVRIDAAQSRVWRVE